MTQNRRLLLTVSFYCIHFLATITQVEQAVLQNALSLEFYTTTCTPYIYVYVISILSYWTFTVAGRQQLFRGFTVDRQVHVAVRCRTHYCCCCSHVISTYVLYRLAVYHHIQANNIVCVGSPRRRRGVQATEV